MAATTKLRDEECPSARSTYSMQSLSSIATRGLEGTLGRRRRARPSSLITNMSYRYDRENMSVTTAAPDQTETRVFYINQPLKNNFCSNRISTAKYNIFSFIPKFLFEQFRRYANIFFLAIALLQQIPNVSPTGRYTTAIPLMFILSVSAIKELVEDWKRHAADHSVNHSKVSQH
jgi:magnesium-transporting ATPase (P-type)